MQRGLSATYPAPISTIFETKDVKRFPHGFAGKKIPNFCAGGFPSHKTAKMCIIEPQTAQFSATGIISRPSS